MLANNTIVRLKGRSGIITKTIPGSTAEYFVRMFDGVRVAAREEDLTVPAVGSMNTPELRRAMKEQLGTVVDADGFEYMRVLEWTPAEMITALTA